MPSKPTNAERIAQYRERLCARGIRPVTVYLDAETRAILKSFKPYLPWYLKNSQIVTLAIKEYYKKILNDNR